MPSPEIALLLELVLDLKKDIGVIKEETAKNTVTLDEHMRRTELAEANLVLTQDRIAKLEARDQRMNGFVKISAGLLGVVASLATIVEVFRLFH